MCKHHAIVTGCIAHKAHKNYSFCSAMYGRLPVYVYALCNGLDLEAVRSKKDVLVSLLVSLLIENWTVTIVCWCFMHKLKPFSISRANKNYTIEHSNGISKCAHSNFLFIQLKTKWMCVVILISDLPPTESCSIYHSSGFYLSIVLCVVILVAAFFTCFVSIVHNSTL